MEGGFCQLVSMRHQTFSDHKLRSIREGSGGGALGGIHTLDLYSLHLHIAVFPKLHNGLGVHDTLPLAVPGAIMLFHIFYMAVLANIKSMNPIVAAVLVAAVMDSAASYDSHIAVVAYIEIIVYHF